MNSQTQKELINFINAVEKLTAATLIHIGMETATEIMTACDTAKRALSCDETIVEVQ